MKRQDLQPLSQPPLQPRVLFRLPRATPAHCRRLPGFLRRRRRRPSQCRSSGVVAAWVRLAHERKIIPPRVLFVRVLVSPTVFIFGQYSIHIRNHTRETSYNPLSGDSTPHGYFFNVICRAPRPRSSVTRLWPSRYTRICTEPSVASSVKTPGADFRQK